MMDHYYAVIMAGGGGTRLWPLSRVGRPKQMLSLCRRGQLVWLDLLPPFFISAIHTP